MGTGFIPAVVLQYNGAKKIFTGNWLLKKRVMWGRSEKGMDPC